MAKMTKTQMRKQAEEMRVQALHLMACLAAGNSYSRRELRTLGDSLIKELVAGPTDLDDLLEAKGGYRPTIRMDFDPRGYVLADIYDFFQILRGDPRRAYRAGLK